MRTREQPVLRPFATITYEDQSGQHTYDITTDAVTIGRGGSSRPVDVKIVSSVDVSREHARIRRDPTTGQCFLTDLSTLGTTLNNRHVPRGYDDVDGVRRETGVETPLPDRARIGLAETVFLEFTRVDCQMTILLWARFAFLLALVALVALYAWAELPDRD